MAGTPAGRIECAVTDNNKDGAKSAYVNIVSFLSTHTGCTLISQSYGGGGLDYPDGGAPVGDGSFSVYRFDANSNRSWDWYLFVAGPSAGDLYQESNTEPGTQGTVKVSAAVGFGGDGNPWLGTTNADGTDTRPLPFWGTPTGGTGFSVVPAVNGSPSPDRTDYQVCALVTYASTDDFHHGVVADDDTVCFYYSDDGDANINVLLVGGLFNVAAELAGSAIVWMQKSATGQWTTGASTALTTGGVSRPFNVMADQSLSVHMVVPSGFSDNDKHPNDLTGDYDTELPYIYSDDEPTGGAIGRLDDFVRMVRGPVTGDTETGLVRAVLGSSIANTFKYLVPWDGATAVGGGATRAGITF